MEQSDQSDCLSAQSDGGAFLLSSKCLLRRLDPPNPPQTPLGKRNMKGRFCHDRFGIYSQDGRRRYVHSVEGKSPKDEEEMVLLMFYRDTVFGYSNTITCSVLYRDTVYRDTFLFKTSLFGYSEHLDKPEITCTSDLPNPVFHAPFRR